MARTRLVLMTGEKFMVEDRSVKQIQKQLTGKWAHIVTAEGKEIDVFPPAVAYLEALEDKPTATAVDQAPARKPVKGPKPITAGIRDMQT